MRHHPTTIRIALAAVVGVGFAATPPPAAAADLRIETRVFQPDDAAPVSESVTCFRDGVAYDFRPGESRVTIFRAGVAGKPARFLLLDTEHQRQTEVSVRQIASTMDKLRRWAATQPDPFLRFAGAPDFEEQYDPETGELRLTSEQLSYRLVTTPLREPEIGAELRGFLDGFAQLHTLLEAGLPPGPRLRVNEALFRHRVIPLQIELTERDRDEPSLRGEYDVAWVLSKRDLQRIDQVADQLASFTKVTNAEFQAGRTRLASDAVASGRN